MKTEMKVNVETEGKTKLELTNAFIIVNDPVFETSPSGTQWELVTVSHDVRASPEYGYWAKAKSVSPNIPIQESVLGVHGATLDDLITQSGNFFDVPLNLVQLIKKGLENA